MNAFQYIVGPILALTSVACVLRAFWSPVRRRERLGWGLLWAAGALVVFEPGLASSAAQLFGIGRGTDFVLYVSVILGFYAFLLIYAKTRRLEVVVTELVRRNALSGAVHGGTGGHSQGEPSPSASRTPSGGAGS